ncbi:MAG TPA: lytic transglycosylase domain-containing protein [Burkholderiales bacterium]|nr:lytic transglycosylase domain-containing protein [Burkholderiales bacterium]
MARIAIIALMLFAAAPALAQQPDTAVPPATPAAPAAPADTSAKPPAAGNDATSAPAATTPAPPADSNATPPPTTTEAPPAAAPTPPPARAGNVDVRESLCLMIESAARAQNLPLEFFARVIWQESRFQADVVGPRTRSGDRAQGIAQFMPRTAAERGLLDPFDPVQALPKSAEFLRELADQFGNLGLAAAAYNAGPGRLREFLSGRRPLPAETRHYVLAITGISVDEWAGSGKREPLHVPKAGCGELMALLHRAPNPFVQKLEERVNVVAAAPWGVQLAAGFSRDHALANYASLAKRYAELLVGRDPSLLSSILRSRGTQPFYQVRVGADTRAAAETLCGSIRRAGGACFVLRNRAG